MSKAILAAIPIKPFGVAKRRLADRLDGATRSRVGRAIAARTAIAAGDAGALVAVVTGDVGVAAWARTMGLLTIAEPDVGGLNGAAEAVVAEAARRHRPWAVIHADLPLVTPSALSPVFDLATAGTVLAPSHDGGTTVIAGSGVAFPFSYGRASFHCHLAAEPESTIVVDPRLALDLDTSDDLSRVLNHPLGDWLTPLLG